MSVKIAKTKVKGADRPVPPALVALAARIEERARQDAGEIFDRVAGSMGNIMSRTGATSEVLAEVIKLMDGDSPTEIRVLVDFARERIIAGLISLEKPGEEALA